MSSDYNSQNQSSKCDNGQNEQKDFKLSLWTFPTQPDLERLRAIEVKRRLRLLSGIGEYPTYLEWSQIVKSRGIPRRTLKLLHQLFQTGGQAAIDPQWSKPISTLQYLDTLRLFEKLAAVADIFVPIDQAARILSKSVSWSIGRATRLIKRYRVSGLLGLTPDYSPNSRADFRSRSTESLLDDEEGQLDSLGPLRSMTKLTEKALTVQSRVSGVSKPTLRLRWRRYRKSGRAGLRRKRRKDAGVYHNLDPKLVAFIEGHCLEHQDYSVESIKKEAGDFAKQNKLKPPSYWQVRNVRSHLREDELALARGDTEAYANSLEVTGRLLGEDPDILYVIDPKKLNNYVRDTRPDSNGKDVCAWVTVIMRLRPRVIVAAIFSYESPDRHTIAAALRQAWLPTPAAPYRGRPDYICFDNGKPLVARYVQELIQELDVRPEPLPKYYPRAKAELERFFGFLRSGLLAGLPGYLGSRGSKHKRRYKRQRRGARITLDELANEVWKFVERYHQRTHSTLNVSPHTLLKDCRQAPPVDQHHLDNFLMIEKHTRKVVRFGIKFRGRTYWSEKLSEFIGQLVRVGSPDPYETPEEISVFSLDGQFLFDAIADDTEAGQALIKASLPEIQRAHKSAVMSRIKKVTAVSRAYESAKRRSKRQSPLGKTPKQKGRKSKPTDRGRYSTAGDALDGLYD